MHVQFEEVPGYLPRVYLIGLITLLLTVRAHAGAVKAFRALNISGEISFKNSGQVYVLFSSDHLLSTIGH